MKMLLGAVVVLVLMIGAPLVYALTDTQKEAGIASDANGVPCTFGPNHDECITHTKDYQAGFRQGYHDYIRNHYIILWTTKYSNDYINGYNHGMTAADAATTRQVN